MNRQMWRSTYALHPTILNRVPLKLLNERKSKPPPISYFEVSFGASCAIAGRQKTKAITKSPANFFISNTLQDILRLPISFSAYDAGSGTLGYRVAKSKWKSFSVRGLAKSQWHRRIAEPHRRVALSGLGPREALAVGLARCEACGQEIRTRVLAFRYREGSLRTNSPLARAALLSPSRVRYAAHPPRSSCHLMRKLRVRAPA